MTQRKIDDSFFLSSSSTKRSRVNLTSNNDRDEFDDIFETKRRRTNHNNNSSGVKQLPDVFDFDAPSSSTSTKKQVENSMLTGSRKIKRNISYDDDENKAIDELFNNDKRKKIRPEIKQEESIDLLDMFKTRSNTNVTQTKTTTIDNFKMPISSKNFTTQKKVKMLFDDSDILTLREEVKEQNDTKDYLYVKPVIITGGQWLSKEAETKSTCKTNESSDNSTVIDKIPDGERNLMHIQYASLVVDDQYNNSKTSTKSKSNSVISKSDQQISDGKSFRKQTFVSDSTIVQKEGLQSCYNALLEDLNKPRTATSSSKKPKKSAISKSNDILSDEEQMDAIDFFDLPSRKKRL